MGKVRLCLTWLFIPIVGLLIYWQSLDYGYVPYDDPAYVSENGIVANGVTGEGVKWAFFYGSGLGDLSHTGVENLWHPLTWISHMLDVELFGIDYPQGHHLVNVLLFILTSFIVMLVSGKLLGSPWAGFLVALLWMSHPLKVESVAWISERKDLLSGFFFWTSLGAVILGGESSRREWHWLGYGLFVLALLSKPSVVVLPVLVVLMKGYLNKERLRGLNFVMRGLRQWWLWFVTAGGFGMLTILLQSGGSHEVFIQESSTFERVVTMATSFWFYMLRIFYPVGLTFEYPMPQLAMWIHLVSWLCLLAVIAFIWLKRKSCSTLLMGFSWFLICWLPISGIIYVGSSFTADRYMYLATAGLCFPLAKFLSTTSWKMAIGVLICSIWAVFSWKQVAVWEDGWSLFTHSTKVSPTVGTGWVNLGGLYLSDKQYEKSSECYEKAIALNPLNYTAWYNVGNIKRDLKNLQAAEEAYRKSIAAYSDYLPPYLNLGLILHSQGKVDEAKDLFMKGVNRDERMLWLACGCEVQLGNREEAKKLLRRLEKSNISNPEILKKMKQTRLFLAR